MKLTRLTNLLVIGLVVSFAAVGCRKKPVGVENIPNQPLAHVPDVGTLPPIEPGTGDSGIGMDDSTTMQPLADPGSHAGWTENPEAFRANIVLFGFDSSSIRSEEKAKVAGVAEYLRANPRDAVRVEGHCDERGTEEYNRALGERRALAVREELIRLGIEPNRVDTISFGEDRPADMGHDENAWRLNRRGEFILLSPPQ
jgi:peptidoglycan-associated lipoprotein